MRFSLSIAGCLLATLLTVPGDAQTVLRTPADRQYALAEGLYQQGLFPLAAEEFRMFAEQFPEDPRREAAVFFAAQSLFQSGEDKVQDARAALESYQAEFAGSTSQYYARSFYLLGEIALRQADETLPQTPSPSEGSLPPEAKQACQKALTAYLRAAELATPQGDTSAAALSRAASCAKRLENWAQLAEAYQALADRRQSVQAQFLSAEALYQLGQSDPAKLSNALAAYKRVRLFGDNPFEDDAAIGIAWCLLKQQNYPECRDYLTAKLQDGLFARIDRDFQPNPSKLPDAYYLLGRCSMEQGDAPEAMKYLRLSLKHPQHPFRTDALVRLGSLLGDSMDRSSDEGAEIAHAVARSLMEQKKFAEATAELQAVRRAYPRLDTAPFREEFLWDLAVCYEQLKYNYEALSIASALNRKASGAAMRARAARLEAVCHQNLASETEDPVRKRSRELEAIHAWKKYADNAVSDEAERALVTVADAYYGKQIFSRARSVYEELLSRFPRTPRRAAALLQLGLCALELKETDTALERFRQCRAESPASIEAVFATEQLAALLARSSDYHAALAEYARLEPQDFPSLPPASREVAQPVFERAAHARGVLRERLGDIPIAIGEFELFLFQFPGSEKSPQVALHLAQLYYDQERYDESLRLLRRFLDPPEESENLGAALALAIRNSLKLGRPTQAMNSLRKVLESSAGRSLHTTAYARLSRIMEESGEPEGARLPYQLLIERERKLHNSLVTATASAREMVQKQQYERAVDYCVDMFAIHAPQQVTAWEAEQEPRRAASVCLRDLDQLRRTTRECLRSAYWELGEVNLRMGDPAAAARAFESLAEIRPPTKQHFEVLLKAGAAWKDARDFEKALATFEEIVRYASQPEDNLRGQLAIGDLWLDSGNPSRSLGAYLRIVNFYDDRDPAVRPWIARALLQSGVAFQRLGKIQEARRQFETLLRDFAEESETKELIEKARILLDDLAKQKLPASTPS